MCAVNVLLCDLSVNKRTGSEDLTMLPIFGPIPVFVYKTKASHLNCTQLLKAHIKL